jgi:hypothetical protein
MYRLSIEYAIANKWYIVPSGNLKPRGAAVWRRAIRPGYAVPGWLARRLRRVDRM